MATEKINAFRDKFNAKINELDKTSFKYSSSIKARDYVYQNMIAASENTTFESATEKYCQQTYTKDITTEAFIMANNKVDPQSIQELSELVVRESYRIQNDLSPLVVNLSTLDADRKKKLHLKLKAKIRELRQRPPIIAVDGTRIRIYNNIKPNNGQNFHQIKSEKYRHGLVMTCYDVDRNIPVSTEVFYSLCEWKAFLTLLPQFRKGTLFIFDRGFMCNKLAKAIENAGCYFLFRLKSNSRICKLKGADVAFKRRDFKISRKLEYQLYTKIAFKPIYKNKRNSNKQIKISLVKRPETAITYSFYTNAPTTLINIANLPDLYHSRWRIEEYYKLVKQRVGGSVYNHRTLKALKLKIYFQHLALLNNQFAINCIELDKKGKQTKTIRGKQKKLKHKDKNPISALRTMDHLIKFNLYILYEKNDRLLDFLIHRMSFYCYKNIRNFRSYPRIALINHSKFYRRKEKEKEKTG